ncbi:hypothetical protein DWB58_24545 [candidate division KSB1 bacterium]|nr:hypothetical protein [candidate division KSB1 bacterium]
MICAILLMIGLWIGVGFNYQTWSTWQKPAVYWELEAQHQLSPNQFQITWQLGNQRYRESVQVQEIRLIELADVALTGRKERLSVTGAIDSVALPLSSSAAGEPYKFLLPEKFLLPPLSYHTIDLRFDYRQHFAIFELAANYKIAAEKEAARPAQTYSISTQRYLLLEPSAAALVDFTELTNRVRRPSAQTYEPLILAIGRSKHPQALNVLFELLKVRDPKVKDAACRGLGHGNTHAISLVPSTPQEMLDLTMLAFELAFKYRNPVVVLSDGYLGQMTGKVRLPKQMVKPGIPVWGVYRDRDHRRNLISSIYLDESDLERHNAHLNAKYARMAAAEQRSDLFCCDDAEVVLLACNTPARMAKGAVEQLRQRGVKAGLFRPLTVWPFPIDALLPVVERARRVVVVEASPGQLEDEMRLALSNAGVTALPPIDHVRRMGGHFPSQEEIVAAVLGGAAPERARAAREEVTA